MQQNLTRPKKLSANASLLITGVIILGGLFIFGYMRISVLTKQIESFSHELASSTASLSDKDKLLENNIEKTHNLTLEIARVLSESNQTVQGLQFAIGETSTTVETLDKLSKTDPELLQKYSKIYFLNEHYTPVRLLEIEKNYLYTEDTPEQIHALVSPYLHNLLKNAQTSGVSLFVKSAFRSFDEQENIKSSYRVTYGAGTANQFSAEQGYSEHQLGTTADFITTGLNGQLDGFENTVAYQWMRNNAHIYGFTLSYPENNAFYIFEPWHWRYVGVKLATFLHDQNKHFYDLDQREIDEYLIDVFE
jgi:LAS superfamily LD-carboxypeptidase LdcB